MQGVTPDSLLALHDAGYKAILDRLGSGRLLDVGCGQGFESVRMASASRAVVGVDYDHDATVQAASRWSHDGLHVAQMNAEALGLGTGMFDWVCSSHLIEHFERPETHVAELSRVLAAGGSAFFLTPNEPADFENPFHVCLFTSSTLKALLERHFGEVWVGGLDAVERVKEDFRGRRERARKVLALDVLDLRHRIPRSWYVGAYTRVLPLAYKVIARGDTGGTTGITADQFFVTDDTDDTTLVLFAIARRPLRAQADADPASEG
jgi:2-polyprenyl-3-methyl-5-hydroxy-6-metoxy-1,4-benzoquinol methylase